MNSMARREISIPLNGREIRVEVRPRAAARPIPQEVQPGAITPRNKPIEARKLSFSTRICLVLLYLKARRLTKTPVNKPITKVL